MPITGASRADSLRARGAQRFFKFLLDDRLNRPANPLPHQLLERAFSYPTTPAIPLLGVILRDPHIGGSELWLNSPDLDAFSLFHQLRDTT